MRRNRVKYLRRNRLDSGSPEGRVKDLRECAARLKGEGIEGVHLSWAREGYEGLPVRSWAFKVLLMPPKFDSEGMPDSALDDAVRVQLRMMKEDKRNAGGVKNEEVDSDERR